MTDEPESAILAGGHARDFLPEYLAGALESEAQEAVRAHLLACDSCAAELRAWERLGSVEFERAAETPVPSLALLGEVWRRIDAEAVMARQTTPHDRPGAYLWNVVTGQARLL